MSDASRPPPSSQPGEPALQEPSEGTSSPSGETPPRDSTDRSPAAAGEPPTTDPAQAQASSTDSTHASSTDPNQASSDEEAERRSGRSDDARRRRESRRQQRTRKRANRPDRSAEAPVGDDAWDWEAEAGDLGEDDRLVSQAIRIKNAVWGEKIKIGNIHVGDSQRVMVPFADATRSIADSRQVFVAPNMFPELLDAIARRRLALVFGGHCGKRTASAMALEQTGHRPILLMPAGVQARALLDTIKQVCDETPRAGILIESVSARLLSELAGFELQRLEEVVSNGAAVILTAHFSEPPPSYPRDLPIVRCIAPSLERIVEKAARTDRDRERALAALRLLQADEQTVSPADALALLDAVGAGDRSPQQLADTFAGRSTDVALDSWLSDEQPAEHVASLTAGATLEGSTTVEVDSAAEKLARMFTSDRAGDRTDAVLVNVGAPVISAPSPEKTFRVADRGWPNDVLTVSRRALATHFGEHETDVVEVCPPHTRELIVSYLWRRLGHDFRHPFAAWLRELASHDSPQVRFGAAVTAGVLFAKDPVIAERELLRPWAQSDDHPGRACAGRALGVPVALGADPAPARQLAGEWGASTNVNLRRTAVLAYGGLLGAWDPGSAAPVQLWRIATETPALQRTVNVSLASLFAAGATAGWARATVLGVLTSQLDSWESARRVYELLPLLVRKLTATGDAARSSWKALLYDASERTSLTELAGLLAGAFCAHGEGYRGASGALEALLAAIARGDLEERAGFALLREMKEVAKARGQLGALGSALERALWTQVRRQDGTSEVARVVLAHFFPTNDRRQLGVPR